MVLLLAWGPLLSAAETPPNFQAVLSIPKLRHPQDSAPEPLSPHPWQFLYCMNLTLTLIKQHRVLPPRACFPSLNFSDSKCLLHPSTQKSRGSSDVSPRFAHTILTFAVTFLEQKTTVDSPRPLGFSPAARFCSLSGSAHEATPKLPSGLPLSPTLLGSGLPPQLATPQCNHHPPVLCCFLTGKLLKILCRNPTYKMAGNEMTLRMR